MPQRLYILYVLLLSASLQAGYAQPIIATQPLAVTAVCPGSTISVSFTSSGTYLSGTTFTVQLSATGSDFFSIPSGDVSFDAATALYVVTATIPSTTTTDLAYTVRIVATNPTVIGTPGTTRLRVSSRPAPPLIANQTRCQQFCLSTATCEYSLEGTPTQGATILWYRETGSQYTQRSNQNPPNFIIIGVNESGWRVGDNKLSASQILNGCESEKTNFTLTLNPNQISGPSNGGGQNFIVCENSAPVTAEKFAPSPPAGFTIIFYDNAGNPYATPPVIPTNRTAQFVFNTSYLSDKGCFTSPRNRGQIVARVEPCPDKPLSSTTALSYCVGQNAEPLSATTTDYQAILVWYGTDSTGGTGTLVAPRPATNQAGVFSYFVAQRIAGRDSERAVILVSVKAGSAVPSVNDVTYCVGQQALQLSAGTIDGGKLQWFPDLSSATGFTQAPVPPTDKAATWVYYVSQTGSTGCESPRVAIRVFVQGPPTLALSVAGTSTVNLGMAAPISLKFTGVGPYQYKITAVGSLTLAGSAVKDTTILVMPTRTTSYQVTEVSNRCGVGLPAGTATVNVTVPTIQLQSLASATVCAGSMLAANFLTTGQFNMGSVFRLQLAKNEVDTTKTQYADLPNAQVSMGQISAIIPTTATSGMYLVRVIATNPAIPILGTSALLTIRSLPTAMLTASSPAIYEGDGVKLSIAFTGDGPWSFSYRDSSTVANTVQQVQTNANPHILDLKPLKSSSYRLTALNNNCGPSLSLPASVLITVNPLLAIEPLASLISVFPIPATTSVTIQLAPSLAGEPATLLLTDETGKAVMTSEFRQGRTQLLLNDQPAGLYILQVRVGLETFSRRLLKL